MPLGTELTNELVEIPVFHERSSDVTGTHPTDLPTNFDEPLALQHGPNFDVNNAEALGVFERSAQDFNAGALVLDTGTSSALLTGRAKGRKNITLSIPTTFTNANGVVITPAGVIIGSDRGSVDAYQGFQLNPGDSVTISTEAPLYVGLIRNGVAAAVVQFIEEVNAVGGNIGAF